LKSLKGGNPVALSYFGRSKGRWQFSFFWFQLGEYTRLQMLGNKKEETRIYL